MLEHYMLFKVLKHNIDYKKYRTSCRYKDFEHTKENEFGIIISGDRLPEERELRTGKYIGLIGIITFNLNSNKRRNGILKGELFMGELKNKLVPLNNKIYYIKVDYDKLNDMDALDSKDEDLSNAIIISNKDDYTHTLHLSQVDLLSDVKYLGKSKMDIPQYSLNLAIYYTINNKEE